MEKVAKVAKNFVCENCNYSTFKKSDYEKHLRTQKHKNRVLEISGNEKVAKVAEKLICPKCERVFKSNSGLWKHNQICLQTAKDTETSASQNAILEVVKKQQDQISQLTDAIKDIAPKLGNNNTTNSNNTNNTNQFNINVFLNEDCKNAINMSDFIKSIEVSLEQLDLTKTKGLEKGITQVIMDNMNKLSLHERPLHCTDTKRETLYIKEDDKWEKDKDKTTIKEVIKKASNKNYTALKKWQDANPDYLDDDAKAIYYAKAMSAAGKPIDGVDEKIIKNVCKQTYVKEDIKE